LRKTIRCEAQRLAQYAGKKEAPWRQKKYRGDGSLGVATRKGGEKLGGGAGEFSIPIRVRAGKKDDSDSGRGFGIVRPSFEM